MSLLLCLFFSYPSVVDFYETKLNKSFDKESLANYMFYIRQYKLYGKALEFLKRIEKKYPFEYSIYLAQGEVYYKRSEPQKGYKCFLKAYKLTPEAGDEIVGFYLKENIKDIEKFVKFVRRSTKDETRYTYHLVKFYCKNQQYQNSFEEIKRYINKRKSVYPFEGMLVRLSEKIGYEKVIKEIKKMDAKGIRRVMFKIYLKRKDYENAMKVAKNNKEFLKILKTEAERNKDYEVVLKVTEELKDTLGMVKVLLKMGKIERVEKILGEMHDIEAKMMLANIKREYKKDYTGALEIYKEIVRQGYNKIYGEIVKLYLLTGNIKKAKESLYKVSDERERLYLTSILYFVTQEEDSLSKAVWLYAQQYSQDSISNDLIYYLSLIEEYPPGLKEFSHGILHYLWGNRNEAIAIFKKLICKEDIKDDAYFYLGKCFEKEKKYAEAMEAYYKVFETDKNSPLSSYALYRAGIIAEDFLKDKNKAKELYFLLIENYPDSPEASLARKHMW